MFRCRSGTLVFLAFVVLGACSESTSVPTWLAAGPSLAAKGPPPPQPLNVTATFYDSDASGPLLTRSDDFNGSGFATYATAGRPDPMSSQINTQGGWQLLLNNQTTRTVYLVLASQGITGSPDGYYYSSIEIYTRCFDGSGTRVSLLSMTAGASNSNCTFGMDFTSVSGKYKLALGPDYDAAAPTGRALVTCTAAAGGSCTGWTVAPDPATLTTFTLATGQGVTAPAANLYQFGKQGSLVFKGSYHNSFSIMLAQ